MGSLPQDTRTRHGCKNASRILKVKQTVGGVVCAEDANDTADRTYSNADHAFRLLRPTSHRPPNIIASAAATPAIHNPPRGAEASDGVFGVSESSSPESLPLSFFGESLATRTIPSFASILSSVYSFTMAFRFSVSFTSICVKKPSLAFTSPSTLPAATAA